MLKAMQRSVSRIIWVNQIKWLSNFSEVGRLSFRQTLINCITTYVSGHLRLTPTINSLSSLSIIVGMVSSHRELCAITEPTLVRASRRKHNKDDHCSGPSIPLRDYFSTPLYISCHVVESREE